MKLSCMLTATSAMTSRTKARALSILGALVTPFFLYALYLVYFKLAPEQPAEGVSYAMLLLSAAAGAVFLRRAFDRFGVPIAVLYFIMLLPLMILFSLFFVGLIFDDHI
jgi:hypothetical protein